jgi:hypothetical protein
MAYRLQEREEEQAVLHLLAYIIRTPWEMETKTAQPNILATLTVMTYSETPSDARYVLVTISEDDT